MYEEVIYLKTMIIKAMIRRFHCKQYNIACCNQCLKLDRWMRKNLAIDSNKDFRQIAAFAVNHGKKWLVMRPYFFQDLFSKLLQVEEDLFSDRQWWVFLCVSLLRSGVTQVWAKWGVGGQQSPSKISCFSDIPPTIISRTVKRFGPPESTYLSSRGSRAASGPDTHWLEPLND